MLSAVIHLSRVILGKDGHGGVQGCESRTALIFDGKATGERAEKFYNLIAVGEDSVIDTIEEVSKQRLYFFTYGMRMNGSMPTRMQLSRLISMIEVTLHHGMNATPRTDSSSNLDGI